MGTKYIILQVFYKAFYEYSIRHSTGYSIVSSVKYIYRWRYIMGRKAMEWRGGRIGRGEA